MFVHQIIKGPGKGIDRSPPSPQRLVPSIGTSPISCTAGCVGTAIIVPRSVGATGARSRSTCAAAGAAAARQAVPAPPPSEAAEDVPEAPPGPSQGPDGPRGTDPPHPGPSQTQGPDGAGGTDPPHPPALLGGPDRRVEGAGRVDVDAAIGGDVDALVDDGPLPGRAGALVGRLAPVGFLVQGLGVGLDDGRDDGGRFVKGRRPVQGQPP